MAKIKVKTVVKVTTQRKVRVQIRHLASTSTSSHAWRI